MSSAMAAASLPSIPRVVFTVVEPLSLVAGFIGAIYDPAWFVTEQIPHAHGPLAAAENTVTENSIVLAWQLGNMYLLMALVGLAVLTTTSEIRVVRAYLVALWLGDIGHIGFTCYGMGKERFTNPSAWNAMAWGNLGATFFLFAMRSLYLTGVFGPDRPLATAAKKTS